MSARNLPGYTGNVPIDKSTWGPGPWHEEPDRDEWRHRGLPCLVVRGPQGSLCGYVAVPPGHPWHGKRLAEIGADVHGGLTYGSTCRDDICHVPGPGETDDVYWVGFDCGHFPLDRSPGLLAGIRQVLGGLRGKASALEKLFATGRYRDLAYVRKQVEQLAEQAMDADP